MRRSQDGEYKGPSSLGKGLDWIGLDWKSDTDPQKI